MLSEVVDPGPNYRDPRMRGFRTRATVEDALALIDSCCYCLGAEGISLLDANGRVLSDSITAEAAVPDFDRAAMDGFALRGEETFGASIYAPLTAIVIGRSRPGRPFSGVVGAGQAVQIATGSPMPAGSNAVLPVELARLEGSELRICEAVPPGRHVGTRGEDVRAGERVLSAGRVLRPQDLGVLSAMGHARIEVARQPRIAILVTGDEVLPAGSRPDAFRVADANSPMLSALVRRDGGLPFVMGPMADDEAALRQAIDTAILSHDCVFISGGTSAGPEDHAPSIVAKLGELPIHGVALRPASPTGLGIVRQVPVLLLPGNPVSCLCAYDFFGGRIVRRLGGRSPEWPYRRLVRALAEKLVSVLGRVDYCRVRIGEEGVFPMATSGASILSSTTRADGFVVVPANSEGYAAGSEVTVWLYDA